MLNNVITVTFYFVIVYKVVASPINLRGTQYEVSNGNEIRKPYVEATNGTFHGTGPREEARAMCSVKTMEVNATANATITRRLHGVLSPREFNNAIQRLEVIIFGQMQQLWQSLDALRAEVTPVSTRSSDLKTNIVYPDRRSIKFHYKPRHGGVTWPSRYDCPHARPRNINNKQFHLLVAKLYVS